MRKTLMSMIVALVLLCSVSMVADARPWRGRGYYRGYGYYGYYYPGYYSGYYYPGYYNTYYYPGYSTYYSPYGYGYTYVVP